MFVLSTSLFCVIPVAGLCKYRQNIFRGYINFLILFCLPPSREKGNMKMHKGKRRNCIKTRQIKTHLVFMRWVESARVWRVFACFTRLLGNRTGKRSSSNQPLVFFSPPAHLHLLLLEEIPGKVPTALEKLQEVKTLTFSLIKLRNY